jgi:hypothetical protein
MRMQGSVYVTLFPVGRAFLFMASPSAAATILSYSRAPCIEAPSPKKALIENIIGQKKRLFGSASAAQQCHNAALVLFDGKLEGRNALTAGRRVRDKHEKTQQKISDKFHT